MVTPGQESRSSDENRQRASYLGESGFMQIFSRECGAEDDRAEEIIPELSTAMDVISPTLQASYADTYFEYAYAWCPILDRDSLQANSDMAQSTLLRHGLALFSSHIRPPLIQHTRPITHYRRAKMLFYNNHENNPVIRLAALMLFYWWSSGPPSVISIDTNWWWMGVTIRLAQEIGLHREPSDGHQMRAGETPGLRRRIWWTLFARERITALCQGRPCIIDPDYCDVREPSLDDFPDPKDPKAEIFIHWVRLCEIMGRVGKRLSQRTDGAPLSPHLAKDLISWVSSLPSYLHPSIGYGTTPFNRDTHLLHLPYLTTITILHLSRSAQPLPTASIAAIMSASCVARIFEDYLARGSVRFLPGQAGWYITIAILALMHGRRVDILTEYADTHIRTLRTALKQLALMWHSAKMFDLGFDRIFASEPIQQSRSNSMNAGSAAPSSTLDELATSDGIIWMDYFPFVTAQTSPLIEMLLANNLAMPFSELEWPIDFTPQLYNLFERLDDYNFDIFNL